MQAVEAARILHSFFDSKEDEESSLPIVGLQKKLDGVAARQKVQTSLLDYFIANELLLILLDAVHVSAFAILLRLSIVFTYVYNRCWCKLSYNG